MFLPFAGGNDRSHDVVWWFDVLGVVSATVETPAPVPTHEDLVLGAALVRELAALTPVLDF